MMIVKLTLLHSFSAKLDELNIRSEFRVYTAIESKRDDIPNPDGGLFDGGLFLFLYVQNLGDSELEHLRNMFEEEAIHTRELMATI